jgi:hypothetical protein
MKSRDARDAMHARVQAAFAKWPRFEDMPPVTGGDTRARVARTLDEFGDLVITQLSYVTALFSCAHDGHEPIGRDGLFIVGKAVE